MLEKSVALDPNYAPTWAYLGRAYTTYEQAAMDFDRSFEALRRCCRRQVGKALSQAIAHRGADRRKLLRHTEQVIDSQGVSDPELLYKVAQAYPVFQDKSSSPRFLHRAIDGGFFPYSYLAFDALLNNVRGDAKFGPLLEQAHGRQNQFERRFSSNAQGEATG